MDTPIGVQIWGQSFIDEMSQPHSDPEIRKMEERMTEITNQVLLAHLLPERTPDRDVLPAHYRNIKL